jgi:putative ABC transport system permease protein
MMTTLWRDLGFAARMLWKNPGFTAVAVLAVALGVGANTTIFSCVNALLLRPFAYETTDRVVMLWEKDVDNSSQHSSVAPANYFDWRDQTHAFAELAAYNQQHFNLTEGDQPERVAGARVTPNLFRVLAAQAERGRTFSDEEGEPGHDQVAIVKHSLWQRRFDSDPDIVGRTVRVDGKPYTVVGVMPESFDFPLNGGEIWTPRSFDQKERESRGNHYLQVAGLLRPGVTLEQAGAEVHAIAERARTLYPDTNAGRTAFAETLTESFTRGPKPYLIVLLGTVGFVLLIACANVANLLLVRASSRQRELAVRAALGASRWRLVRQLLTESVLLALIGGAAGLLFSVWGVEFIAKGMPPTFTQYIPGWKNMRIDSHVLLFTLAASMLTGVVFGIVPALQATRTNLNESLKEGGQKGAAGGLKRNRMRSLLVVAEIALSLVLLAGAGLMVRSFVAMLSADIGLDPRGVLKMDMSLPQQGYPEARQVEFYNQLVGRVEALPGVRAAAAVNTIPMSRAGTSSTTFEIVGRPPFDKSSEPYADYRVVTQHYFEAAGTRLLRGRGFNERDDDHSPRVVIVSDSFTRRFFPAGDALGQHISVWKEKPLEIVGIAEDVKNEDMDEQPPLGFYFPLRQDPWGTMSLVVRTDADPESLAPAVRAEVRALDAELPVYDVRTMKAVVDEAVSPKRLTMFLMAFFAAGALLLSAVGLYAVMSYTVAQRRHEIGIRMALGAQSRDVMRLVLSQGLALVLVGLGLGLVGALALTRVMASILYGVSATDPLVFGGVASVLGIAALLACYLPARRATKVDPMIALRYE